MIKKDIIKLASVALALTAFATPGMAQTTDGDVFVMRRTISAPRPPVVEEPAVPAPSADKYDCNYRAKEIRQYANAGSSTSIVQQTESVSYENAHEYLETKNFNARIITYSVLDGKMGAMVLWDAVDPAFNSNIWAGGATTNGIYFCKLI